MDAFYGEIRAFAFNWNPNYWFPCDGRTLPVQSFNPLFAVIGYTYGGSGNNFKLPDLRGSVPIHFGDSLSPTGGFPAQTLGQIAGADTVALSYGELPYHTHMVSGAAIPPTGAFSKPATTTGLGGENTNSMTVFQSGAPNALMNPNTISSSGTAPAQPHENRQPYLAFNYCICWQGEVFPIRP